MTLKDRAARLWRSLASKEYRDSFVSENINSGVAVQIREIRKARNLTQKALGKLADMDQSRICKLENPDYGTPNLSTLVQLAAAFDCGLSVRFVPFSELTRWALRIHEEPAAVVDFSSDNCPVLESEERATTAKSVLGSAGTWNVPAPPMVEHSFTQGFQRAFGGPSQASMRAHTFTEATR